MDPSGAAHPGREHRAVLCRAVPCRPRAALWQGYVWAGPCLSHGHDKSPLAHAGRSFLQVFSPALKPSVEKTPPFFT